MSVEASTWAWRQSLPASRKIILLALADHCNKEGEAWPSIKSLMSKGGVSRASVYRALQAFREAGWLAEEGGKWILTQIRFVSERDSVSQGENRTTYKEPSLEPSTNQEDELFAHWKQTTNRNGRTQLTPQRRKKLRARLKDSTAEEIREAIDGCAGSQWHRDNGQTDLELICRNRDKLEGFIERGRHQQNGASQMSREERAALVRPANLSDDPATAEDDRLFAEAMKR